jgi:sugar (pentulose or hexulose) kinase
VVGGRLRAIGMRDTVRYFQREAEANWIAQHQPELWARTDKYLLLSGYLNYRFTGRFVDSVAVAGGLCALRLPARPLGRRRTGLEVAGPADPPQHAARAGAAGTVIGSVAPGRAGHRHSRACR